MLGNLYCFSYSSLYSKLISVPSLQQHPYLFLYIYFFQEHEATLLVLYIARLINGRFSTWTFFSTFSHMFSSYLAALSIIFILIHKFSYFIFSKDVQAISWSSILSFFLQQWKAQHIHRVATLFLLNAIWISCCTLNYMYLSLMYIFITFCREVQRLLP